MTTLSFVCPKCHSVYEKKYCILRDSGGQLQSRNCQHVAYPNHPQTARRKTCGTPLMKKVRMKAGTSLQPFKVYPYCSIRESIARLVARAGFLELCEQWRARQHQCPSEYLGDIYDGRIWHDFNSDEDLASWVHLLTLNVD